jgi:hypothetical protein
MRRNITSPYINVINNQNLADYDFKSVGKNSKKRFAMKTPSEVEFSQGKVYTLPPLPIRDPMKNFSQNINIGTEEENQSLEQPLHRFLSN